MVPNRRFPRATANWSRLSMLRLPMQFDSPVPGSSAVGAARSVVMVRFRSASLMLRACRLDLLNWDASTRLVQRGFALGLVNPLCG